MPMQRTLQNVRVARPCPARWEEMVGDERVRFCSACRRNVYNLSAMTETAVLELLHGRGEVCGLLYRRRDGTVLTADCAIGRQGFRRRVIQRILATVGGVILAVGGRFLTPDFRAACLEVVIPESSSIPAAVPTPTEASNEELEQLRLLGYLS
ncbi:MAG: hypothetical protein AMXMBFR36_25730 [Acidobacteriota bacterium]